MILFFGGAPSPVQIPKEEPKPLVDENELARQRADLDRKRRGRASLRIDASPAQQNANVTGLRIQ